MDLEEQFKLYKHEFFEAGPWQDEPDEAEFELQGYKCHAKRNQMGCWCGYVEIPQSHPASNIDIEEYIEVHGGVTFCQNNEDGNTVIGFDCCHMDDIWPGRFASQKQCEKEFRDNPEIMKFIEKMKISNEKLEKLLGGYDATYKTLDFVKAQCASMIDQLEEIRHGKEK